MLYEYAVDAVLESDEFLASEDNFKREDVATAGIADEGDAVVHLDVTEVVDMVVKVVVEVVSAVGMVCEVASVVCFGTHW